MESLLSLQQENRTRGEAKAATQAAPEPTNRCVRQKDGEAQMSCSRFLVSSCLGFFGLASACVRVCSVYLSFPFVLLAASLRQHRFPLPRSALPPVPVCDASVRGASSFSLISSHMLALQRRVLPSCALLCFLTGLYSYWAI